MTRLLGSNFARAFDQAGVYILLAPALVVAFATVALPL